MALLLDTVRRCWRTQHPSYLDESGELHGVPLMTTTGPGWSINPAQAFAMGIENTLVSGQEAAAAEGYAPPDHATTAYDWVFDDVIDRETGGMRADARSYDTSFFTKGLKYFDPVHPHRLRIVFSTSSWNVLSRYERGMEFLAMDVWESFADGHF